MLALLAAAAACSALPSSSSKEGRTAGAAWQRFIIEYEGVIVELRVPPGGEPPPVPDQATTSVLSAYLLNLRYGYARDYAPDLHLVAYFWKRPRRGSLNPSPEDFLRELEEINRQWREEAGLKPAPLAFPWQPRLMGGRTWYTGEVVPDAFPYEVPVSSSLVLGVRGKSSRKRASALEEHRRITEEVVASVRVIDQ